MENNRQVPKESAPAAGKFSALPERTRPEEYVQEVDVDQVNFVEPTMDDWLRTSAG
ncbi:hypothetical protein [Psychromicrobium lacuslunae]|uniref:hypothetical protein n=1 Tax=Psychromicrobium lacuslunae TaxID=1618207 RepID=UPI000A6625C4|nr:hypothetical protein [Psychromicrobium lacuslunae]